MMDSIHLCIADIHFAVSGVNTVQKNSDTNYRSFYSDSCDGDQKIDVRIYPELPDSWNGEKKKVFDSESSWSMFRNGSDYFITVGPEDSPFRLAGFNLLSKEVQIYCNEASEGKKVIIDPFCYPLDRLLMMYFLSKGEGAMLHAAGIIIGEKGYIFPGISGAGKSTLARQFSSGGNNTDLTDERVVIRKIGGTYKVFGSPWPGEAGIAINKCAPLAGIFFINHGPENKAHEIKAGKALQRLLPLTTIPWYDPEITTEMLHFCEDLIYSIPAYDLHFKPDEEIVDFIGKFTAVEGLNIS